MLIGHDNFQGRAQQEFFILLLRRLFYFEGQMHKMVSPTATSPPYAAGCITCAVQYTYLQKIYISAHTNNFGKGNLIFISYYKDAEIKPCVVHDNPRQTHFGVLSGIRTLCCCCQYIYVHLHFAITVNCKIEQESSMCG